jgi:hypothetical protein
MKPWMYFLNCGAAVFIVGIDVFLSPHTFHSGINCGIWAACGIVSFAFGMAERAK